MSMQILLPFADSTSLHTEKRIYNSFAKYLRWIVSNGSTRYLAKVFGVELMRFTSSALRTEVRAADSDRPNIIFVLADDVGWK